MSRFVVVIAVLLALAVAAWPSPTSAVGLARRLKVQGKHPGQLDRHVSERMGQDTGKQAAGKPESSPDAKKALTAAEKAENAAMLAAWKKVKSSKDAKPGADGATTSPSKSPRFAQVGDRGHPTNLHITFLNVGNADCALVHWPATNYNLLIDIGRSGVAAELVKMGVAYIDDLVLSHAHRDHIGGVTKLLDSAIGVRDVVVGTATTGDVQGHNRKPKYDAIESSGKFDGTFYRVGLGRRISWSEGDLKVIVHGARDLDAMNRNENLHSTAVELQLGVWRALFVGDAEQPLQDEWAKLAWAHDLETIHLYKIAHHGSRNGVSEDFWHGKQCHVGVFSTSGRYGHPHAEARRFFADKCPMANYLTKDNGNVVVEVAADGSHWWSTVVASPELNEDEETDC